MASDEDEPVHIHQSLLSKSSEFFKRALKPEWASSRKDLDTIDLRDDLVEMVILYVRWLNEGELHIAMPPPKDDSDAERSTASSKVHMSLAEAYVFGEKIMDNWFEEPGALEIREDPHDIPMGARRKCYKLGV